MASRGSGTLEATCRRLAERHGDLGEQAAERLRQWLSGDVPHAHPGILERHLGEEHVDLLFDAFYQPLPIGTGGRRGRVGYGANRFNPATLAMSVQGHCDYLRRVFPGRELVVVVANDVRIFRDISGVYGFLGDDHPLLGASSRSFARLACEIYAGNGVTSHLAGPGDDAAVMTTPELSFLIAELGAVGGVNLSASHNPPDDNGVKVYDEHGSQPIAPLDQELVDAMAVATEVRALPFEEAIEKGLVRDVPAGLHDKYVRDYVALYGGVFTPRDDVPITYTPLCGSGLSTVGDVLRRLGFPLQVPPDQGPDGSFRAIPFRAPNPEVPQATEPARAFADAQGSEIVLSSDPDADRVGLEVKLRDGSWHHFDGNQIAAILCHFLMLDPKGPQRRGLVIETLVTTKLLGRIVEEAGDSWLIDDLLVGFKYVADVLNRLERGEDWRGIRCTPQELVLAAEESHGVIVSPEIRDKDATPGCMYLAALHQRLHAEGRTLLDYYGDILERFGGYDNVNRSIMMTGADGTARKDRIMASLRESPPGRMGGQPVRRMVDYWDEEAFGPLLSETDRLPRNTLQLFTDAFIVTVRPSGTEPKLKLYCQLLPEAGAGAAPRTLAALRARADDAAAQVYRDLLARIDLSLSDAALLLPDIIDVDRKREFEERTAVRLKAALAEARFEQLDPLLDWLREEVSSMMPGVDALPAVRAAVGRLCDEWAGELGAAPLLSELRAWGRR